MAITPDIWFGTNDVIYSSNRGIQSSLSASASHKLDFGLSDMAELPGQSTIYVNKLKFVVRILIEDPSAASWQEGKFCAGIVPRDAVGAGYEQLADFQDYMAWPLKGCVGFNFTPPFNQSTGQQMSSFTMTYSPRDSLLINREQNIILTYRNTTGPDVTCFLSCVGQFKRAN